MEEKYLLGIDIGTGSLKITIIDKNANVIATKSQEYELSHPYNNYTEIKSNLLWETFINCLKRAVYDSKVDLSLIKGIGISCLCPGLTGFDKDNNIILDPIIYSDRRSTEEAEFIENKVGKETIFKITGNRTMAGAISSTTMLWIKNNKPNLYKNIKYFGHINSLFAMKLTGKVAIDYTNASYTGLFETTKGLKWSETLCDLVGIDMEKLPPIKKSYEVVGGLIAPEIIELGIKKDTPVVIGGADTACAAFTVGIVEQDQVFESVGTTNVLTICSSKPKFSDAFVNRCHVVDDRWLSHGALTHTGSSLRWFRDNLCNDYKEIESQTGKSAYELMDEDALKSGAGANGIVFLPYMLGERSPIWDPYAQGVFFGMSLFNNRGDMIRSILESCGYGLRQLCEITQSTTGSNITKFKSVGGGAKSKVWAQIKADITGKDIDILDCKDAASVGAALLAGVGCKVYSSLEQARNTVEKSIYAEIKSNSTNDSIYKSKYEIYNDLYPRIKDLYQKNQTN